MHPAHTHSTLTRLLFKFKPSQLQDTKNFEFDEWNGVASTPYLSAFMPEAEAEAVTRAYLARAVEDAGVC